MSSTTFDLLLELGDKTFRVAELDDLTQYEFDLLCESLQQRFTACRFAADSRREDQSPLERAKRRRGMGPGQSPFNSEADEALAAFGCAPHDGFTADQNMILDVAHTARSLALELRRFRDDGSIESVPRDEILDYLAAVECRRPEPAAHWQEAERQSEDDSRLAASAQHRSHDNASVETAAHPGLTMSEICKRVSISDQTMRQAFKDAGVALVAQHHQRYSPHAIKRGADARKTYKKGEEAEWDALLRELNQPKLGAQIKAVKKEPKIEPKVLHEPKTAH